MKRLRILHLLPNLSGGGAERQCSYLTNELGRMGHHVGVGYLYDGPARPELPGVARHQLHVKGNHDPYIFCEVLKLIRRVRPDVLQTWILQMDVLGGMAGYITGTPWILREPCSAKMYPATWKTRLRAWSAGFASAIVSNSMAGDSYWKGKYPDKARYIIPNGIPLENIVPILRSGNGDTEVCGNKCLLYAGRLEAQKNIGTLIEAFARVVQEEPVYLMICGEGSLRESLERQAGSLGLARRIQFTGFLPSRQLWELMRAATLFVFVSSYEGFPNALVEAMTCGCPLVASDIPEHRELLDEDCALFVDPGDPAAIADAIRATLTDEEMAQRRARMARMRARQFSVSVMAQRYEQVYMEVLSRGGERKASVVRASKQIILR